MTMTSAMSATATLLQVSYDVYCRPRSVIMEAHQYTGLHDACLLIEKPG